MAFSGSGAGTSGDPYQITSWAQLAEMNDDLDAHYILMNDLDSNSPGYDTYAGPSANGGEGWLPIGDSEIFNSTYWFSGSFDGGHNTIGDLYMDSMYGASGLPYSGLFGVIYNGSVSRVGVVGADITGLYKDGIGVLAGLVIAGSVSECYTTGEVKDDNQDGYDNGGLIGKLEDGATVSCCYTTASVVGGYRIGGLIGRASGLSGSIVEVNDCWAGGSVTETGNNQDELRVGGLIGWISYTEVNNCYAIGNITADAQHLVGGLIGDSANSTTTDSFWDTQTSGQATSAGGTGKTTAEMKDFFTFPWDLSFSGEWGIHPTTNDGYPFLRVFDGRPDWSTKRQIRTVPAEVSGSSAHTNFPALILDGNIPDTIYNSLQTGEIYDSPLIETLSPLAYYRFESGSLTTDSSGNGLTLTGGGATETTGRYGGGANFVKASSQNLSRSLITSAVSNVTMSAWVYLASSSASGAFIKNGTTGGYAIGVGNTTFDNNGNNLILLFELARWINTGVPIGTGWHHVAMVLDSSQKPSAYLDGALVYSDTGTNPHAPNTTTFIGGYTSADPNDRYFNGVLDEVAIFSSALSLSSIRQLYLGGRDLRISSDPDGENEVPVEIVTSSIPDKKAEIWVKIPSLEHDTPTPLFLWAGNKNHSLPEPNDPFGSQAVWGSSVILRHHYGGSGYDSSQGDNGGTISGATRTDGKIGRALYFDGSGSHIQMAHKSNQLLTSGFTMSAWIKPDSIGNSLGRIFDKSTATNGSGGFYYTLSLSGGGTGGLGFTVNNGTPAESTKSVISYSEWNYVAITVTSGALAQHYLNGLATGSSATTGALSGITTTNALRIGARSGATDRNFDGVIDEARITTAVLSADWLMTEYNNQNSPTTFWKIVEGNLTLLGVG